MARCEENIQKLLAPGNMHIHLDLIAGLPYEDYASFSESFNRVFALRPHCIQLGFLKLLRGSALRAQAERYGYRYSPLPPYEVLSTPWLSYGDLLRLGDVETAVDAVYNSGRFPRTLLYLTARFDTPFAFFYRFSQSLREAYPDGIGIPSRALCELLLAFTREQLGEAAAETVNELLKYDFFATDSSRTPPKALCRHELPGARALYDADRAAGPRVQYERFAVDPLRPENGRQTVDLRFDYTQKDPVTGRYAVTKL